MKNYIIAIVVLGVIGMLYFALEGTDSVEYVAPAVEKEQSIEELPAWQTDEEAVKAAQAVIDRKNNEALLASVQEQLDLLEKTYKEERTVLLEKETEIEKELGLY